MFQTNDLEIIQFQFFIKESAASFSIKFCAWFFNKNIYFLLL